MNGKFNLDDDYFFGNGPEEIIDGGVGRLTNFSDRQLKIIMCEHLGRIGSQLSDIDDNIVAIQERLNKEEVTK